MAIYVTPERFVVGDQPSHTTKPRLQLWIVPLVLLAVEYVALSLLPHRWFIIHLYRGTPVVFGLTLLFFGGKQLRTLVQTSAHFRPLPAIFHFTFLFLLAAVQQSLNRFGHGLHGPRPPFLIGLWLGLLISTVASLVGSFFAWRKIRAMGRALGSAWIYAAVCSALVVFFRQRLQLSWDSSSYLTSQLLQEASFSEARQLLHLFYPIVVANPITHVLGTDKFQVNIAGACSGIEGLALVSVFMLAWLFSARNEVRAERALLLAPFALLLMWLLNLIRLVALIAIGTAGHPDVAINGFHSQAGWIGFNLVALGFLFFAQRIPWIQQQRPIAVSADDLEVFASSTRNVAAIYLGPFLAITAASLVSQAVSGSFEWLYPLRLLAALVVLWHFRAEYARMDWRCGPLGLFVGVIIGLVWLGIHFASHGLTAAGDLTSGLARLSAPTRVLWITLRVLAAVITVPVAEELTFRGFLARRVLSADVESISLSRLSALSIAISSLAFGWMHGQMWIMGTMTGIAFALLAKRRGRLGEAVGAHMAANLVLAIVALGTGNYSLWS